MAKLIDLEQGSQEWHEYRRTRIGASDASIISGMNPWRTAYALWCEKLGLTESQQQNEAMRRGHELEPIARNYCAQLLGIDLNPVVLEQSSTPWRFASYDGVSKDRDVIVEIKCPMLGLHEYVPSYYMPQLQHQMIVANVDRCFYFSFDGKNGKFIEVKVDKNYCEKLLLEEEKFYQNMINFEAPQLVEKDYKNMENDKQWMYYANLWRQTTIKRKYYEDLEKETREKLIELSSKSNAKGANIALSKIVRKGNVEYCKIPELKNVDLDEYRKPNIEIWRLTSE